MTIRKITRDTIAEEVRRYAYEKRSEGFEHEDEQITEFALMLCKHDSIDNGEIIATLNEDAIFNFAKFMLDEDDAAESKFHEGLLDAIKLYHKPALFRWYDEGVERYEAEHNIDVMQPTDFIQRGE